LMCQCLSNTHDMCKGRRMPVFYHRGSSCNSRTRDLPHGLHKVLTVHRFASVSDRNADVSHPPRGCCSQRLRLPY
jgi:hypothetical protein